MMGLPSVPQAPHKRCGPRSSSRGTGCPLHHVMVGVEGRSTPPDLAGAGNGLEPSQSPPAHQTARVRCTPTRPSSQPTDPTLSAMLASKAKVLSLACGVPKLKADWHFLCTGRPARLSLDWGPWLPAPTILVPGGRGPRQRQKKNTAESQGGDVSSCFFFHFRTFSDATAATEAAKSFND